MHFHLPKPLHGWRAFVGEVGIIVVGVLIALSAEQVVENWHWRERVADAREALHGELADHYLQAVEWRMVEPCIAAQIAALEKRLAASGATNDPAPSFEDGDVSFTLRTPTRPYTDSVWQGMLAQGVSAHLSAEDQYELGSHYKQAKDMEDLNKAMVQLSSRLKSLSRAIALDPNTKFSLFQTLDSARDTNQWMGIISGQLVGHISRLHMQLSPEETRKQVGHMKGTAAFCMAHNLPLLPLAQATQPGN